MPKSLNKVFLIGNLGKEVEVRYTPGGTAVASFSMATTSSFKNKAGDWEDKTEWHNITVWARLAEIAGEYLHKGSKVHIEGRLETQSWEDKESGKKMYKTVVVAHELIMLDSKKDADKEEQGQYEDRGFDQRRPSGGAKKSKGGGTAVTEENPITDEDIPF